MRPLLAKFLARLPFYFPKRHGIIKRLWNEGEPPIIRTTSELSFGNLKMHTDSRNHIEWQVLLYGCYEKELVQRLIRLTKNRPRRVAVDIGANSGQYSLILSRYFERVYSFEPVRKFYEKLQANVQLNGITNIITHNFALGAREDEIKMAILENHGLAQTASWDRGKYDFKDPFHWEPASARQVRLDDILQPADKIDFIKIDTDGSEAEILEGAVNTLKNSRPLLQIELIDYAKYWLGEKSLNDIARFLKNLGYELYDKNGHRCRHDKLSGNYFAVPA